MYCMTARGWVGARSAQWWVHAARSDELYITTVVARLTSFIATCSLAKTLTDMFRVVEYAHCPADILWNIWSRHSLASIATL